LCFVPSPIHRTRPTLHFRTALQLNKCTNPILLGSIYFRIFYLPENHLILNSITRIITVFSCKSICSLLYEFGTWSLTSECRLRLFMDSVQR
jgi:hypothetical protein